MSRVGEIFTLFLRLGSVAFGGPAAHIALLEAEVVERRRWCDRQHFLDLVAATQLVPGPNSTEMVMHVGLERGRYWGLVAAAIGFIGPAALITLALAWVYVEFGSLPRADGVLAGIQPIVVAVILAALWRLGLKAIRKGGHVAVALAVLAAISAGLGETPALLGGAVLGTLFLRLDSAAAVRKPPGGPGSSGGSRSTSALALIAPSAAVPALSGAAAGASAGLVPLGLFFFKVGAILYGSGYVLIAFIEGGLVEELGWLTSQQLLDAVAVGQLTPGPVLTTATFVGFLVAGVPGAAVATLAIFLPSVIFVAILNPLVPRLRRNAWTAAFLEAVAAAAVALMATVTFDLAGSALASWPRAALFAVAAGLLVKTRISPVWLVLAGAALGLALGDRLL